MRLTTLAIAIPAALAALASQAAIDTPAFVDSPTIQEKKVITSADQLPRRQYQLTKLPSELIDAPKADLDAAVNALDKDLENDLATLDIRDRAARTGMINARAQIATYRGDFAAAQAFVRDVRSQQEKAADKLTSGVTVENILAARIAGGPLDQQRAMVKANLAKTWAAMPWDVVGDNLKSAKGGLELLAKNVVIGSFQTSLDPAAKNLGLNVPGNIVVAIVSARNTFAHVVPFKDDIVAVLQGLVDRNQVAKVDLWSKRLVTLPASASAKPVVVGIWDSGTDVKLFKPAASPGIAFDKNAKPTEPLVRPMGSAEPRLPELKRYVKGSMDLRAAIDSPDARALKQKITSMKPEEVKQFSEDLAAVGMWVHGTHVAGIAVDGNPFARVTAVAMHWPSEVVPQLPTEETAKANAAAYKAAVAHFSKAGARVVNMSWRYGPSAYEGALAYHNVGKTPEERKQMALKIFEIEKQALEEAFKGAPGILFVAGSGNEDNSADFSMYIPAGFELPNLITAGAVDMAGSETAFSTFGKTVVVHANGFEVDSFMPGGERTKLSGTSMASPQVANLAAKLFAMKPDLTPAQVKELILKGAERNGRVNLINPVRTLELAGVKPA
jgi:subtilisin family serine protease